jgi:UDP-N-acetylmuramyl tripeptide synthase
MKAPTFRRLASELAEVVLVTDDNPRTESAVSIRSAILVSWSRHFASRHACAKQKTSIGGARAHRPFPGHA